MIIITILIIIIHNRTSYDQAFHTKWNDKSSSNISKKKYHTLEIRERKKEEKEEIEKK